MQTARRSPLLLILLASCLVCPSAALADDEPNVDLLVRELRSLRPEKRALAAESLGQLGPLAAPAVRGLVAALHDQSPAVQIEALIALKRIGPAARAAVPDLLAILKDDNEQLQIAAIDALGTIGHDSADAVPVLLDFLKLNDESLGTSAGLALVRILPEGSDELPVVVAVLVKSLRSKRADVRSEAVAALGLAGQAAVGPLTRLVEAQSSDADAARQAAAALEFMGPISSPAVGALTAALRSKTEQLVVQATGALGAIGPESKPAVSELLRLLASGGPSVRTHAASALGQIGPGAASAVDELTKALKDRDAGVRREAAEALGKISQAGKGAVPALVGALNDDDGAVAMHAGWALGRIGADAVPHLIAALKDEKRRHAAVVVLGDIGPAAKPAVGVLADLVSDSETEPEFDREILLTLARIGPEAAQAVPVLMKILEDENHPLRASAAYALAKIGAKEAVPLLIKALPRSDDREMQIVAPVALALLEPRKEAFVRLALPRLVEMLADKSELVRHEAAVTIAHLGPAAVSAVPKLIEGLNEKNPALRSACLEALAAIGPDAAGALPSVIKSLADANVSVRYAAIHTIGRFGPAAKVAAPLLERNLQEHDDLLQVTSAWALVHVDPDREGLAEECLPPLIRGLHLADPRSRSESVEALGLLGPAAGSAAKKIARLKDDPDESVRAAVATALKKIEK